MRCLGLLAPTPTYAYNLALSSLPQPFPASISALSEQWEQPQQQPDTFGHIFPTLVPSHFIYLLVLCMRNFQPKLLRFFF